MNGHPKPAWRNRNVLILAFVSLLNDAASDMVVPLLPAFLLTIGAGAFALRWIEGSAGDDARDGASVPGDHGEAKPSTPRRTRKDAYSIEIETRYSPGNSTPAVSA